MRYLTIAKTANNKYVIIDSNAKDAPNYYTFDTFRQAQTKLAELCELYGLNTQASVL